MSIVAAAALQPAFCIAAPGDVPIEALWIEPADLASRDLIWGPGGEPKAPRANEDFRFIERDTSGHSSGYRVTGADGREWKIKIGDEAQSEVAVSRILWAVGYHQPTIYYVPEWRMVDGPAPAKPAPGRFRLESGVRTTGTWSWSKNPFLGTQPFRGLIVINVLLNNWDLAPSQNRIYAVSTNGGERTWYVVQDLGAALGKTRWPLGTRNNIDHFEKQEFVLGAKAGRVEFDFHGARRGVVRAIGPDDVVWACRLLSRLSDKQLEDAFIAAGYTKDVRARFIVKIRAKIRQGLALEGAPGGTS